MKPWKAFRSSILRWCSAAILAFGVLCVAPAPASAEVGISFGVFYDSLAPYGEWLYVGNYGRVWRPRVSVVGVDFRPYVTGGHWVYTDYGWSFESDYDWGWAPFHYGRWLPDPRFGWVWIPDTVWAPAWVDWRYGDGYIGWAPLAPAGGPIVIDNYYSAWCFVPTRHFLSRDFYHHAEPFDRIHVHFGATVPIHNQVTYGPAKWYVGPPAGQVAAAVGQPVRPVAIVPPRPGAVQPVHAGVPTVVSAPVGRTTGTPVTTPNVARLPAPVWSAGHPVTSPAPVPGTSTQAAPSPQFPRPQPGWGAHPAPSQIAPAPQPRPTFVQPVPTARAASPMPVTGRAAAAPQAPSFHEPSATFRPPTSYGTHAPVAMIAPRAAPSPVAPGPAQHAATPNARGTPIARAQVR